MKVLIVCLLFCVLFLVGCAETQVACIDDGICTDAEIAVGCPECQNIPQVGEYFIAETYDGLAFFPKYEMSPLLKLVIENVLEKNDLSTENYAGYAENEIAIADENSAKILVAVMSERTPRQFRNAYTEMIENPEDLLVFEELVISGITVYQSDVLAFDARGNSFRTVVSTFQTNDTAAYVIYTGGAANETYTELLVDYVERYGSVDDADGPTDIGNTGPTDTGNSGPTDTGNSQTLSGCVDSDGSLFPGIFTAGEVETDDEYFVDECVDFSVKEYYCEDGVVKSATVGCKYGCENDECRTQNEAGVMGEINKVATLSDNGVVSISDAGKFDDINHSIVGPIRVEYGGAVNRRQGRMGLQLDYWTFIVNNESFRFQQNGVRTHTLTAGNVRVSSGGPGTFTLTNAD